MKVERYSSFAGRAPLMFITHRTSAYTELDEVKMVSEGGCAWIQLRMKDRLDPETAGQVSGYLKHHSSPECVCCIDDDVTIALQAGAGAVHLGKQDMPVSEACRIAASWQEEGHFHIGATANTFEDIVHADREGASYIGLGPFRFTETKKKLSPVLGLEGYRRIMWQCREAGLRIPVFAIGGICLEDIGPLMETGITGIAVSGAIIRADDPVAETRRFIDELNKYKTI